MELPKNQTIMATILNSDVTRQSTVEVDGRPVLVTLTEDQQIQMRLKGLKSGNNVSVGINTLFDQLNGQETHQNNAQEVSQESEDVVLTKDGDVLISIRELRSLNAVTKSSYEVAAKLDEICVDLLGKAKIRMAEKEAAKKPKKEIIVVTD